MRFSHLVARRMTPPSRSSLRVGIVACASLFTATLTIAQNRDGGLANQPRTERGSLATPIAWLEGSSGTLVSFNSDGSFILTSGLHEARAWDARTFKPVGEPVKFEQMIFSAQFLPDGKTVLTVTNDEARLWDARTGRMLKVFRGTEGLLTAISPDGSRVALIKEFPKNPGRHAGAVHVVDIQTDKEIASIQYGNGFDYILFSPDGRTLLTAEEVESHTHAFHLWDLETGKERLPAVKTRFDGNAALSDELFPAAFSPDSRRVAILGGLGFVVHDLASGEKLADTIPANDESSGWGNVLSSVAFTANRAEVLAFQTTRIRRFDVMTGQPLGESVKLGAALFGRVLSGDGTKLIGSYAITEDGTIAEQGAAIWDLRTGQQLKRLLSGDVGAIAFSPDGRLAAAAEIVRQGEDRTLIWEIETTK